MSDPAVWNPVTIAAEIRKAVDRMEQGAAVTKNARAAYLEAKRAWTVAKAVVRQEANVPGARTGRDDRDDKATIATQELWVAMDMADVAHAYSRDLVNTMEKRVSALQTEAKLIMQAYNTSGVGER